jgi:ABC-type transport system involved in cytochrome c biogenesis permease subunit
MKNLAALLSLCLSSVFAADANLDFTPLESIAIQSDARIKPLRVYADEVLEEITGRPLFGTQPYFRSEDGATKISGLDLYLSLYFQTRDWRKEPLILVPSAQARQALGLPSDKKRVSLNDLQDNEALATAWRKSSEGGGKALSAVERELMDVLTRMETLERVLSGGELPIVPHPTRTEGAWLTPSVLFGALTHKTAAVEHLADSSFNDDRAKAEALLDEYLKAYSEETIKGLQTRIVALAEAHAARDANAYARAAKDLRDTLAGLSPSVYPSEVTLARELTYHTLRPFRWTWVFYFLAGILGLLLLTSKWRWATAVVWVFFGIGLAFHLYGFTLRALIAGRAPVSNMYESVVWAALGCTVLGLIFELRSRKRYFLLSSALAASVLLLLMDLLPIMTGDPSNSGFDSRIKSFNALVPVLKDHFWLAVHVLTITLSYGAFALAWLLAHFTLGRVLIRPRSDDTGRELLQYVYSVLKAGVFLLAVGTVLGAFWGHYAWGRFWGWDSKETWSLITLLAYVFVLHMRFTGYWNDIAFAVGAVVCFLSVVMAWYGVNFILGSGLHSYGTGSGGLGIVAALVVADLVFVGVSLARRATNRSTESTG